MNTLDQLPFEILPSILEHVQRKDLLTCTLVNKHFYKAALPLLWRELRIRSDKALNKIITILSTSSSTPACRVRLLFIYSNSTLSDAHLVAMIKHVPYLEKLVLPQAYRFSDTSLQQVPRYCPHLTSLNINGQSYSNSGFEITDASMIAFAQHCHQLTDLTLSHTDGITNASMLALGQHCHQLTHLTLRNTPSLDFATLLDHFHGCSLTFIKILSPGIEPSKRQRFVESATLGLHRHHQQTLTTLYIGDAGDDILTMINTHQLAWPHLTSFNITGCDNVTDAMATTFMQAHPKLQNLSMQGSHYLTNQYLDNVTRWLPNLLSLNVINSPQITASGICRLIKHYEGQLVDGIDCCGCDISTDDEDFPEELDFNGYETTYYDGDLTSDVTYFYADAFK